MRITVLFMLYIPLRQGTFVVDSRKTTIGDGGDPRRE